MNTGLQVEGLACSAGYRLLFHDLDLRLAPGNWLRLSGPNGSGKSTLLRTIAGLIRQESGQVLWNGSPRQPGSADWHAQMLYQGHAAGWKDHFNAGENLALQLDLDRAGDPVIDVPATVRTLLGRAGLASRHALAFNRLSAGQRHRLSLARLAASEHALWLLDEPTTALDQAGQALFGELLRAHLQRGACAIVATHLPIESVHEGEVLDLGQFQGTAPGVAG